MARLDATLNVAGIGPNAVRVELRPRDYDGNSLGDGRRAGWHVWDVDLET